MNNIPCEMIKDLIPLYIEDVCSEKSKDIIEDHLVECENCREYLEDLQSYTPIVIPQSSSDNLQPNELHFLRNVKQRLKKQKILLCGIMLLLFLGIWSFLESAGAEELLQKIPLFDQRIKADCIHISEIYELENGSLYITLNSTKAYTTISYLPLQNGEPGKNDNYNSLSLKYSFWDDVFLNVTSNTRLSFVIPLEETYQETDESGELSPVTYKSSLFYYEGKGDKRITIWKQGQNIKPAPKKIEEKVERARLASCADEDIIIFDDVDKEYDSVTVNLY